MHSAPDTDRHSRRYATAGIAVFRPRSHFNWKESSHCRYCGGFLQIARPPTLQGDPTTHVPPPPPEYGRCGVQELAAAAQAEEAGEEAAALRAENGELRDGVEHLGHAVEHAQVGECV